MLPGLKWYFPASFSPGSLATRADFLVRGNRVVPKAHAREDMRWHVLGVGRRRRDFRVTLRCLEAFLRERRIVVEMDEIVGDARVLGLALEDRFQQRRAFW